MTKITELNQALGYFFSATQLQILEVLDDAGGPMTQREIEDELRKRFKVPAKRATILENLNKLKNYGYIILDIADAQPYSGRRPNQFRLDNDRVREDLVHE